MQLSVKQYDTLVKLDSLVFKYKNIFTDEVELIESANDVLAEIYDKHIISNKKTADYIARKRVENKNYARSKSWLIMKNLKH